jgi:hypothetical protein
MINLTRVLICSRYRERIMDAAAASTLTLSLVLVLLLASCSDTKPGPTPFPVTAGPEGGPVPTPPPGNQSPSGQVFEHTTVGRRPLAGFRFSVLRLSAPAPITIVSDANGRYEIPNEVGLIAFDIPFDAGYRAPCPAGVGSDLHVVSDAVLSRTGTPASMPMTDLHVSGTVVERVGDRTRPIAGAEVQLGAGGLLDVKSVTLSDASGRFLLCTNPPGTGTDQTIPIAVRKDGYDPVMRTINFSCSEACEEGRSIVLVRR